MLLKLLFVSAKITQSIVLLDAADEAVLYAGPFEQFPYCLADWVVDEISANGNKLVIKIYN